KRGRRRWRLPRTASSQSISTARHNHITLQLHHLSRRRRGLSQWVAMSDVEQPQQPPKQRWWSRARWRGQWRSFQARSTRRALLLTALGGLLIAGLSTALPAGADESSRLAGVIGSNPTGASQASRTFKNAKSGDCLTWPN